VLALPIFCGIGVINVFGYLAGGLPRRKQKSSRTRVEYAPDEEIVVSTLIHIS
jgi:hypothetical protein